MATLQNFSITKGRTHTLIVTVTGVTSWTDLKAKLVAAKEPEGTAVIEEAGEIDSENETLTFTLSFDDVKRLSSPAYKYEVILYKDDKSFVKTVTYGTMRIEASIVLDPTAEI